jgi:hypothetical protein
MRIAFLLLMILSGCASGNDFSKSAQTTKPRAQEKTEDFQREQTNPFRSDIGNPYRNL